MNNQLIIPKSIKLGYQKREDTYTNKLAYITYIDSKGKLRKEGSWKSWRDAKIPSDEFTNEPVTGFVLNKDVGGSRYSGGWDARVEKVRVYDPRGFEFEIDIPNLLFILQEASSIKGKGLEGAFVYAWHGTKLILLPVDSQEYKNSVTYTELQDVSVGVADMVPGCTYLTKDQVEVVYLGRHNWFDGTGYYGKRLEGSLVHVFIPTNLPNPDERDDEDLDARAYRYDQNRSNYWVQTALNRLAKRLSQAPVSNYAELAEKLLATKYVSRASRLVTKPFVGTEFFRGNVYNIAVSVKYKDKLWAGHASQYSTHHGWSNLQVGEKNKYSVSCGYSVAIKDGKLVRTSEREGLLRERLTADALRELCCVAYVVCENGTQYKLE